MTGWGEDVTDWIRPETDDHLALLAAALHEYAVITLDTDGYVTSWNPGAERIKGYRAEEIIGQHYSVFYPHDRVATGHPGWALQEAAKFGSYSEEGWRVRKDGTRFWAYAVISALRSTDGTLHGFAKVTRDDTESRARLERSVRQFADLFGLTPVGIGLFDESGHVLDANKALCDLLGYGQHEFPGRTSTELLHPDDRGEALITEELEAGSPSEHQQGAQRLLVRSDGQRVYCELHIARSERATGGHFWLVVFQDVTERHRQTEALHYRATHDELTGLPNRAAVSDLLSEMDPERVAVLYCDLNNFKRVNDSLGHAAGDELLVMLGRRLQAGLPDGWSVARPAGDEYLIICPDVPAAGGIHSVTTLVSRLLRTTVPLRGQLISVSASIGIAVPQASEVRSEDLVRFASAAVIDAKSGPERISLAGPALIASVDRQLQLEEQLRTAIDTDALTLHYQPIVAADGQILAAEALVRWSHPQHGLIMPAGFLPVAEQGDLLGEMDRWVLRTAMREAASWPAPTDSPVAVTVNLAGLVPDDPNFLDVVTDLVTESGIDWHRVILELVESSLIDLPSRTLRTMNTLVDRGVRFAVDDFGTGYSSLARLREFPAQVIKADRRFVSGIGTDLSDFAVVRAVTDMAHAMGCFCIAEGVETANQFHVLQDVGVNAYQGWLFSPAVPAAEFRALLERGPLHPTDPT